MVHDLCLLCLVKIWHQVYHFLRLQYLIIANNH